MRNRTTLATLVAGLLLGASAHASEPATPAAQEAPNAVIAIDRATGQYRAPTAAEMKALQNQKIAAQSGAPSVRPQTEQEALKTKRALAGGGFGYTVPAYLMSSLIATRGADGKITLSHSNEAAHADASSHADHAEQETTK